MERKKVEGKNTENNSQLPFLQVPPLSYCPYSQSPLNLVLPTHFCSSQVLSLFLHLSPASSFMYTDGILIPVCCVSCGPSHTCMDTLSKHSPSHGHPTRHFGLDPFELKRNEGQVPESKLSLDILLQLSKNTKLFSFYLSCQLDKGGRITHVKDQRH